MSERARELAERFERVNGEVISAIERCTDEQWRAVRGREQWSVAITARHIAGAHAFLANLVHRTANGESLPPLDMDLIDQENARDAEQHKDCTRADVLELLRTNGANAASMVRRLTDEQLQRSGGALGESVEAMIVDDLIGHAADHAKSVKAAVGA